VTYSLIPSYRDSNLQGDSIILFIYFYLKDYLPSVFKREREREREREKEEEEEEEGE
jgi:hypothetical protein